MFFFYYSLNAHNLIIISISGIFFILITTVITALLPYQLSHLFPATIRYTGAGLSFNLADGIIGGFTPAIALLLVQVTGNQGAFCWYILICAIISLISFFRIKEQPLKL